MSKEGFLVQAIGPDKTRASWLTAPKRDGLRTFGPRELAEAFSTWDRAADAVRETRRLQPCVGVAFEIHAVKSAG
jgi:hypothetical protein